MLLEHFNIMKENLSIIVFQVLNGPSHGWLEMHDVDHTTIEKRNVTMFINADILKQRVTYTHDDSESMTDAIYFVAYGAHGENFQVRKPPYLCIREKDNFFYFIFISLCSTY